MAFWVTPISGNWHLAGSLIYWLGLLFCAFAAGCVMLTATAPSTKEKSKPSLPPLFPPATYIPEVQPQGRRTVWVRTLTILLGIGISAIVGYGIRDYQLIRNTHTYLDVQVLEKYSDTKYLLQPARMQPWISNPCDPVSLTKGSTMKFYTYEQMLIPDCHRVKAFEFYANSKGERVDASIQIR